MFGILPPCFPLFSWPKTNLSAKCFLVIDSLSLHDSISKKEILSVLLGPLVVGVTVLGVYYFPCLSLYVIGQRCQLKYEEWIVKMGENSGKHGKDRGLVTCEILNLPSSTNSARFIILVFIVYFKSIKKCFQIPRM